MKCPLFTIASTLAEKEKGLWWSDCLKDECAWWMAGLPGCALMMIAGKLDDLDTILGTISDKMPHAGQFTK